MKQKKHLSFRNTLIACFLTIFCATSCEKTVVEELNTENTPSSSGSLPPFNSLTGETVFLVIDEESIDNGNKPNNFSETDVNDQLARIGQRKVLSYFNNNPGKIITLYTGDVGDEGWHALKTIPSSWKTAGPTGNGTRNFLQAGPGLGGGNDPEKHLDKIPDVTPLRATGLKMMVGKTILAVVFDSDVSVNYSPLEASLKGDNLGIVAFDVLEVRKRTDGSSSSLPSVIIRIRNAAEVSTTSLKLFSNAPVPRSSSEPFDINPPSTAPAAVLTNAN